VPLPKELRLMIIWSFTGVRRHDFFSLDKDYRLIDFDAPKAEALFMGIKIREGKGE
jgi:hypothetical protein